MVLYELVLTLDSGADGTKVLDVLKRTARTVVSRSGVIRRIDNWGERPLAHRIRKNERDHHAARYVAVWLDAHPAALGEVDRFLKHDRTVLRRTAFRRKVLAPEGNGFLSTEIRNALQAAEEGAGAEGAAAGAQGGGG
mmetsp:Transcript_17753/g.59473  ORF Transcript_17753/g.59473 Transcript_17753/m.59473 type:complete len:138 (-) Transcript_17753:566-979(-)